MQNKLSTVSTTVQQEFRLRTSPQTIRNKWITVGVLALAWVGMVICLLH